MGKAVHMLENEEKEVDFPRPDFRRGVQGLHRPHNAHGKSRHRRAGDFQPCLRLPKMPDQGLGINFLR